MLKNVYFFTWEEKYLLDQEVNRWTSNFSQKFWKDAISLYNNENRNEGEVKQSVFGGGLFSDKKLTIIDWLPLWNDKSGGFRVSQVENFIEEFLKRDWKIPSENLLVFISSNPDKRSRMFKFLKENVNIKEFNLLKDSELRLYIKKELWDLKIEDDVLNKFIQKVWWELYRINSEVRKLKMYCEYNSLSKINFEVVNNVVFWLLDAQVFDFLKLILSDKNQAINYLQNMQDQGLNWNAISGILYWWLKLYIVVYQFAKKGIKDIKTMSLKTWINSYSLSQNIKDVDVILKNWIAIENMYKRLIEIDVDIKNGKKLEQSFWLETKKLINSFKIW